MLATHQGSVKYVIKHFPLSSHRFAFKAAMAALAANNQGKYWEFHHELFKNFRSLNDEKIVSIAESLGLDMDKFNQDRLSAANRQLIQEDLSDGQRLGVRGTPTVFINGKKIDNRRLARLSDLVAEELAGQ